MSSLLELLPPDVLNLSLSKLTPVDLARAIVSTTLREGVLISSSPKPFKACSSSSRRSRGVLD